MEWFGWIWNDLPTQVAVVGSVVYAAVMPALAWWTSRHYVRSAATNWRWTSWEKAVNAEGGERPRGSRLASLTERRRMSGPGER